MRLLLTILLLYPLLIIAQSGTPGKARPITTPNGYNGWLFRGGDSNTHYLRPVLLCGKGVTENG